MINWYKLTSEEQFQALVEESKDTPVLIFKHSTACSVSSTAKGRLERQWEEMKDASVKAYYLDLLAFRPISNLIARQFNVRHESPQVLLIQNGECIYNASHLAIRAADLKPHLALA